MRQIVKRFIIAIACTAACWQVQAASYCGSLNNAFGPYDYRQANGEFNSQRDLVESHHFSTDVENLVKGQEGYVGGDLDYTLRAFPNHHRALASMAKLGLRSKDTKAPGMTYSFTCYFERAMRFTPDDDKIYVVYGTYLYKRGDVEGAIKQLKQALALNGNNAPANYNLGLIYLQQNKYDKARTYAKKAYSLDYPVQGLKNGLVAAGKWGGS